jgi:streptomycin 6-kinase
MRHYERMPALVEVVPRRMYESGRELATALAEDTAAMVLLHGDLTPVNVLEGGGTRGLVAIDPAPCLGDPAFDAVDLVLWRAEHAATIATRAEQLAALSGADADRVLAWCTAFAGMVALETAENGGSPEQVKTYVGLAARA